MNIFKFLLSKLFKSNVLAANESIVLFEQNTLADAEFYQDVTTWGGERIAAEAKN